MSLETQQALQFTIAVMLMIITFSFGINIKKEEIKTDTFNPDDIGTKDKIIQTDWTIGKKIK